jgi:hypothetical protein
MPHGVLANFKGPQLAKIEIWIRQDIPAKATGIIFDFKT